MAQFNSSGINDITTSVVPVGLTSPFLSTTPILANTETLFTIPVTSKQFTIKSRGNSTLRLSWAATGTTTNYLTIPSGCDYTESGLLLSATLSIYVRASEAETIEFLYWT